MGYTKMKDLQILALLLNTIIPKDGYLTEKEWKHLSSLHNDLMWDIAEKYGLDINNGHLDPITLEFKLYDQQEEEAITCNN